MPLRFVLFLRIILALFFAAPSSAHAGSYAVEDSVQTTAADRPYALVAGGSKGIGYAIAEALAKRGYNLVLIARHEDALRKAEERLETAYGIQVDVLVHDLSREESAEEIAAWCRDRQLPLRVLCNVAGFGGARDYLKLPLDSVRYMVRLNLESTVALTYTLLPLLEKNAPSHILNVASMAGFAPISIKNVYSATKSAVVYFSYSLHQQLKKKNISVSCLAPGPVFTKPEIEIETKRRLGWLGVQMAVPQEKVGEIAVRKMLKGKRLIVPGFLPSVANAAQTVVPLRWMAVIYGRQE